MYLQTTAHGNNNLENYVLKEH